MKKVILKQFFKFKILGRRSDSFEAGYSPKVCFGDQCNKLAGSIKGREFLYSLRDLSFLKWDSAPQYISTGKKYSIAMSLACLKVNISYSSIEATWSPLPSSSPNHDSSYCQQQERSPLKQQQQGEDNKQFKCIPLSHLLKYWLSFNMYLFFSLGNCFHT